MVLRKKLPVHPGPIVEALEMGLGGELKQILIALPVPGQQGEVIGIFIGGSPGAVLKACKIELAPQDRLYPSLSGSLVKFHRPIHGTVIGDRHAIHPQLFCPGDELRNAAQAIEEAIFGMNVEVGKHEL
jgi:hypothetical protein